ncbi:MAG: ABC transporter ATP-binding protein [Deltaproteobacteria bacterium]|nr:ABC transporter ATP-binding protein [Deltaproteobacteria bacterium]
MGVESKKTLPLRLKDLSFSYENKEAIKGLSLDVQSGALIALLGPNGSGKSTALKVASGILEPSSGEVLLWGKPITSFKGQERAKLISYMPQNLPSALPFTVTELSQMGRYPYGKSTQNQGQSLSILSALKTVGLLEKANTPVAELSGGEKRRVFIALALVQGSGTLLLDEPLANLDIKYQLELIKLLKGITAKGEASVVMALHDITTALSFDYVFVMKDGLLYAEGTPHETITKKLLREVFEVEAKELLLPVL